ncbi:MAG: hypothetical protein ABSD74_04485 [Rhizomicrobium sp.]
MTEEDRAPEGGGPASPLSDASAWAALSAASREKADAFLDQQKKVAVEQEVLVHLQAKELAHELALRHWSLRVRHISDVMKLAFEFAVAVILLAIAGLIAGVVWSAAHDTGAVIEAFSVPPDMAARGITGEVVASKLLDRLSFLQAQTDSTRAASSYAGNWGDDIKVQIPDTGISLGELNRFLHGWLGHETRITGDIYRTADGIAVTARAGDQTSPTFAGRDSELDTLLDRAARAVYRATQPYRYARYLTNLRPSDPGWKAGHSEGLAILRELTQRGTAEDRAWAYDGLGSALLTEGDIAGDAAMQRKSIAVLPGLDAYDSLANVEHILGHEEEASKADIAAIALANRGVTFGLDSSAASQISYIDRQELANLRGDYPAALAFGRALHEIATQQDERYHFDTTAYRYDANACAGLHDPACLDAVRAALGGRPDSLAVLDADIALGHFKDAAREVVGVQALVATMPPGFAATGLRVFIRDAQALIAADAGDLGAARRLIGTTPVDCAKCVRERAAIDVMEGNFAAATFWFRRAVAAAPSIPFGYSDWGAMLLHEGKYEAAVAKFHAANVISPHFADPLEMWGEALMQENRSDLALAKFEEADKYAPNWGHLHLEWGKALVYAGRKDEAKKEFKTASHLDLSAADGAALARWRASA